MIIGITGSFGAGKGETAWEAVARPCQLLGELVRTSSVKVYSTCKVPVPVISLLSLPN